MESKELKCQNCEQHYTEGYKFCPHCGQKTNEELTIGVLFYNTISNYFSFDARFLKSFFPLMFRPGYLAKRFLEGKRLLYLHPAQMYLFVSVIFFFLTSFSVAELRKEADQLNERIAKAPVEDSLTDKVITELDSIKKEELLKNLKENQNALGLKDEDLALAKSEILKNQDKSLNLDAFNKKKIDSLLAAGVSDAVIYKEMGMTNNASYLERGFYKGMLNLMKGSGAGNILQAAFDAVPITMFILLPLFAFILKIFYYYKGRYAHHLVFSFYFFSFLFTLFAILMAFHRFVYKIPAWISWLIVLSTFFYFYLALLTFYQRRWFTTLIKSGIITFIFLSIVIPTTAGLLVVFGFINS